MGVQGLWQLLNSTGKPVSLESLEGKILAVDVSIWLHQAAKGMRDKDGNPLPNAHLHSLFTRVCKLLFYRIKPVFVFDGGVPTLKKQTLAARRERKEEAEEESGKATKKLLENLIRSQAVKAALGQTSDQNVAAAIAQIKSPSKARDMFELPPLPEMDKESTGGLNFNDDQDTADPWDETLQYHRVIQEEFQSLDNVDVESDEFKALPAEIKHEILTEMKEVRKRRRLGRIGPMPENSDDFSAFQMAKLVKQSRLTNHIESVRKEMNTKTTADFSKALSEDYMHGEYEAKRVMSEDASHYILIKGLSKQRQLEQAAKCEDIVEDIDNDAVKKAKSQKEKADFAEPDELLIENDKEDMLEGKEKDLDSRDNDCCINIGPDLFSNVESKGVISSSSSDEEDSRVNENGTNSFMKPSNNQVQDSLYKKDTTQLVSGQSVNIPSQESLSKNGIPAKSITDKCDSTIGSRTVEQMSDIGKSPVKRKGDEILEQSKRPKALKDDEDNRAKDEERVESPVEVDSEDDDDEGFIEISVNPTSAKDDDLFPAEMFKATSNDDLKNQQTLNPSNATPSKQSVSELHNSKKVKEEITTVPSPSIKDTDKEESDEFPKSATVNGNAKPIEFDIGDYQLDEESGDETAVPPTGDQHVEEEEDSLKNEFTGMTTNDLESLQSELTNESETLRAERGRQERLATSITDQMNIEAQDLLQLFGIPYIVSPMEAEAQCAQLDILGLTHGTITDDSDIWLFGGSRVYKNFFNQRKVVESFNISSIQSHFGLDRDKLITLAYLCGSDYTEGIQGVGPVTALELLGEFPGTGIQGLANLKSWWDEAKSLGKKTVTSKVKGKLRELEIRDGFPNPAVVEAYLHPTVDESSEIFSWGSPDLDLLRDYAKDKMGWIKQRTDDMLLPVLKQLNKKESQVKINSYFQPEYFSESKKPVSKRIKQASNKVKGIPTEPAQESTNETRLQRAKEVLGIPKGRGRGRGKGRGKGRGAITSVKGRGSRSEVKVKEEVDLSESSSSDEGGFIRDEEEEKVETEQKGGGDRAIGGNVKGKGKGRGKNRK